jgi:hypothetical protein
MQPIDFHDRAGLRRTSVQAHVITEHVNEGLLVFIIQYAEMPGDLYGFMELTKQHESKTMESPTGNIFPTVSDESRNSFLHFIGSFARERKQKNPFGINIG